MTYLFIQDRADAVSEITRRKLIEKAVYSIPTKTLKELIPKDSSVDSSLEAKLASKSAVEEVMSTRKSGLSDPGRLVPVRMTFPDLIIEKSKERDFLKELSSQLKVGLSGIGDEPLAATVLPRLDDSQAAVVQLSLPLLRAEQLRSILSSSVNLLSYTPLLRFGKFDDQFFANSTGSANIREPIAFPAPEIVSRLDEMERRYLEIRDRRNLIESFHQIMKLTNPYDARVLQLDNANNAPDLLKADSFDGPIRFPWEPIPVPERSEGYDPIYSGKDLPGAVVRGMPPNATVVLAKNAMETAMQQLSIDGVQLSAASAEITRRIEEAEEAGELGRIADAGLASPAVLEQLLAHSTLRREQQRQTDELKVLAAWEKDQLNAGIRENNLAYMQRLFALATGDDDTLAELDGGDRNILDPKKLAESRKIVAKEVEKSWTRQKSQRVGVVFTVGKGSNIPQGKNTFVRVSASSQISGQTSSSMDGNWDEEIFLEIRSNKVQLGLYEYNALGLDTLLAACEVNVRDTNDQVGIWILNPAEPGDVSPSIGITISVEKGAEKFDAYSRILPGGRIPSDFPSDLQSSQNYLRERNMDWIFDQVERVEEERHRIEGKIGHLQNAKSVSRDVVPSEGEISWPIEPTVQADEHPIVQRVAVSDPIVGIAVSTNLPPLRQVAKPFPTYESLYKELRGFVEQGKLGEVRQLCFDYVYVGQGKLDFHRDPKTMDYLSLISDVLSHFRDDVPIVVAGLNCLCVMIGGEGLNRAAIGLVLWEAAARSIPLAQTDTLLSDQILTSLSLVVHPATNFVIDFVLSQFEAAREPIQLEQVMQLVATFHTQYRLADQISAVLSVLERCRFNQQIVLRALIALVSVWEIAGQTEDVSVHKREEDVPAVRVYKVGGDTRIHRGVHRVGFPEDGSDIQLVVVAAGMYVDVSFVQVAAIDALCAIVNVSTKNAEMVENILSPVLFDQSFDRNQTVASVHASLAKLVLRIADIRGDKFNVPESVGVLMRIVAYNVESVSTQIIALAAIRICFKTSRPVASLAPDFVSGLERGLPDASLAKEACLTIEALVAGSVDLRESLIRAGVVSIPLLSFKMHSVEYPRMAKNFLSALQACVSSSNRGAFQFARLDGVQILMDLSNGKEWRIWAILADSCTVEEARKSFSPDDDIARILEMLSRIGREGDPDIEVVLQSVRLVGEIIFNSSMSTNEIFEKINSLVRPWFTHTRWSIPTVLWGLLCKKIPPHNNRFTTPTGSELTFELSQGLVREYNVWVTTQGGAKAGAPLAKTAKEELPPSRGFVDSLTDLFEPPKTKSKK